MVRLSVAEARRWRREWDLQQDLHVPDREARFEVLLAWLEGVAGEAPRCLDLGCGTGAITERVVRRLPRARVVAVDWDPVTRRLGEVGLAGYRRRITWIDADLREANWVAQLPSGRFDAALSSTALHWLRGEELSRLYTALGRRLRPGGVFLNADRLSFDRGARRLREVERHLEGRDAGPPRVGRRRPMSWDAWWAAIAHAPSLADEVVLHRRRFPGEHLGTPTPDLAGHVRRLRAAGFREAEIVYSRGASRVLVAVR